MDTKPFEDLQADPRNPRYMTDAKAQALSETMQKFGDLGCIVFNRRNGTLVGGHMRVATLKKLMGHKQVTYTTKFEQPDAQGTVALGYVWHENAMYSYREVDWPEDWHLEANQAANNNLGDWDWDMLPQINQELLELGGDLAMTGWSDEDMNKILAQAGTDIAGLNEDQQEHQSHDDGLKQLHARFTDEQLATVYEAIGLMKRQKTLTNEPNTDLDANAVYYICKSYVDTNVENATSHNDEPAPPTDQTESTDPVAPPTPETDATLLDTIPTIPTDPGTNAA